MQTSIVPDREIVAICNPIQRMGDREGALRTPAIGANFLIGNLTKISLGL